MKIITIPDDPNYDFPRNIVQKGWDSGGNGYPIEYHTYESLGAYNTWVKGQKPDSLMLMLLDNECLNSFYYFTNDDYTDYYGIEEDNNYFVQLHIELHCVQFVYVFYKDDDNYYLAHVYIADN